MAKVGRTLWTVGLAVVLAGALCALPATSYAAAAPVTVKCGQTVTASIRLANDLVGCPGDGLRIGADHITLDLAGHAISGVNAAGSEGIADDGHAGVQIKNGTVQGFFLNGVALRNAPQSAVVGMKVRRIGAGGHQPTDSAGVLIKHSPHTVVSGSSVTNDVSAFQSDGVDVLFSEHATISGNRLAKNAWDGLVVIGSPGSQISGNTLNQNKNQGAEINAGSDGSSITGNQAEQNVANGLVVGAISGARIEGNDLMANQQVGLFMFDLAKSLVQDNRSAGNDEGLVLDGGQHGSTGNNISNNDTSRNVHDGLALTNSANHNTVVGNISTDNQGIPGQGGGIILDAVAGNSVTGNVVMGNRDVGIGVFSEKPGDAMHNVLTGNVAISNRNHGISVVAGTTNGGGNFARDNTPSPNCVRITCST